MAADPDKPEPFTLRRWSRRKLEAARTATPPPEPAAPRVVATATPPSIPQPGVPAPASAASAAEAIPSLPPIESLTIDSDFVPFLKPTVDEGMRRAALKKLFADPRFNVMDGLDVYIDDYSKFTPIPPDIVRQLTQARYIFDPPKTRVSKEGFVEDVPPEEPAAEQAPASPETADAVAPEIGNPPLPALPELPPVDHAAAPPPSVPEPSVKKGA